MLMTCRVAIGLSTLAIFLLPSMVAAQNVTGSLDELLRSKGLRPGDGVYVTDASGRRVKGTISALSPTALMVTRREETWTLTSSDVRRIERQDSWANGLAYGIMTGAASFYGMCHGIGARECGWWLIQPRVGGAFMAVGGVVGVVVDALRHKTVYRAPGSRRVRFSPTVSPESLGTQVSISW